MVTVLKVDWLDVFGSTFDSVMRKRRASLELLAVRLYIIYQQTFPYPVNCGCASQLMFDVFGSVCSPFFIHYACAFE